MNRPSLCTLVGAELPQHKSAHHQPMEAAK